MTTTTGRRYLAFDIETAKVLPREAENLFDHRPLGVACVAAFASDSDEVTTWHGHTETGSPAPKMSPAEVRALLADLAGFVADGYTLATWNGAGFEFDILAEESGDRALSIELATDHVDMMFHVLCSRGYYISLQKAALGMSLAGKLEGVSGAEAPAMWARGEYDRVLEYNVQDARLTAELAVAGDEARRLRWITRRGSPATMPLPEGWLSVRHAMELPLPDNSWMTDPPSREDLIGWMG